mmetsp:Transcript_30649/g.70057  ORF Transcript_30649/g.70057 Transcript_30649/m.70057 type:complete len:106 (-) Transcript_30649:89-406(-)
MQCPQNTCWQGVIVGSVGTDMQRCIKSSGTSANLSGTGGGIALMMPTRDEDPMLERLEGIGPTYSSRAGTQGRMTRGTRHDTKGRRQDKAVYFGIALLSQTLPGE